MDPSLAMNMALGGGTGTGTGASASATTTALASSSATRTSAVDELESVLRSPPPTLLPSLPGHGASSNPAAVAHAALEAIRESGDENLLLLRAAVELAARAKAEQQQRQQQQPRSVQEGAAAREPQLRIDPSREELFFHCVTGCRQAVLWQWRQHSAQFCFAVRDYCMALGHELGRSSSNSHQGGGGASLPAPSSSSKACRLACYTASVALWKRGWMEEDDTGTKAASWHHAVTSPTEREAAIMRDMQASLLGSSQSSFPSSSPQTEPSLVRLQGREELWRYLEGLFHRRPEQAAAFSSILVGEFSGRSAVSYRLPLEFHKGAHRSFERTALLPLLTMGMAALSRAVAALDGLDEGAGARNDRALEEDQARAVVQLAVDAIGWEFGVAAWDTGHVGAASATRTLIRPPHEWRHLLVRPDLVGAVFHLHHRLVSALPSPRRQPHPAGASSVASSATDALLRGLRQLLLQLASLSGPVFSDPAERAQFAARLTEGTVRLLEAAAQVPFEERSDLPDALQLVARIVSNFRLAILAEIPSFLRLLQGLTRVGTQVLSDQLADCRRASGDLDSMDHREWREDVMALLLDCAVLLCGDPWILYSATDESRRQARSSLSEVLGPLYEGFVVCRTKMAALEENYAVSQGDELDDVREDIAATDLEDELGLVSVVGRLNLSAAIACLSNQFGQIMPSLHSVWGAATEDARVSSILEESRIIIMYVCQLLTDDNKGETPAIPDAVVVACQENPALAGEIAAALQALMSFAESHAHKVSADPSSPSGSPMLAKSFLWLLNRWAPAYIYPTDYGESNSTNSIVREWSSPAKAQQSIDYCVTLCLHYQCCWPQEPQVQQAAGDLMMSLARRSGAFRSALVSAPSFQTVVRFHCLTASVRHSASQSEFDAIIRSRIGANDLPSMALVWGYRRVPYQDKACVVTAILVACSDPNDPASVSMMTDSLKVIHDAFSGFVEAISTKQVGPADVHAKEMACLCIEMFCGVVQASEMADPHRIPQFVTPYLPQLAALMNFYADDLTVGEALLRFFRDYAVNFIVSLDREQSLALFASAADALKSYSSQHCERRVIRKLSTAEVEAEEEQEYSDILCAIQLLINLSAKDFIDACTAERSVNSSQVTDMIFFGLQQILPLMTQGLLQFPNLCEQFFELVGFMMDTYPDKVCNLPYELFNSLLESLLFGMSHHSSTIANCSLHGIASLVKEHLETQALQTILQQHPDILDRISRRLLAEVVFQSVVVDRIEAAGMALLPLAAVDVNRFAGVVHELTAQVPNEHHRLRLQAAFQRLIQPEALARISAGGYEGRMNRARFKKGFEEFVNEVHSFLVLR